MQADKTAVTRLLRTAKGQIEGILRMVEEDRYCIEISNQILATQSILAKINRQVLRGHMEHCVRQAFLSGDEGSEQQKIEEILDLLEKMAR